MRRWLTGIALGATVMLALAGCGTPEGTDGDLVDDWAAAAEAKVFVPEAGTCHTNGQDIGFLSAYNPVDCGQPHRVETLHLGTLAGANAERSTPPPAGSAGVKAARAECDRQVNKALGADWRTGRIGLNVVFPSPKAWTAGARWFRCDVNELKSMDDPSLISRTGSLRGALTGNSTLAHRCFNPKMVSDDIEEMVPVSCTSRHQAEFVGVYQAPDTSFDSFIKSTSKIHKRCLTLIATYTKVPNNGDLQYRAGTIFYHPYEEEWKDGNRGVQCFLWLSDRNLTRSLKGAGTKALPVQ